MALIAVALIGGAALAAACETVAVSGPHWDVIAVMVPGLDGSVAIGGGGRADEDVIGFLGGSILDGTAVVAPYDTAGTYQVEVSGKDVGGTCTFGVRVIDAANGQVVYSTTKAVCGGVDTAEASGEDILSLIAE